MVYYFKCPKCGSDKAFSYAEEEGRNLGCLLLLFGGIIPALLYGSSRANRIQCGNCGLVFKKPAYPIPAISKFINYIVAIGFLFIGTTYLLSLFPEWISSIPEYSFISTLEVFIKENPMILAIMIPGYIVAMLSICLLVALVHNMRANSKLKEEYKVYMEERVFEHAAKEDEN